MGFLQWKQDVLVAQYLAIIPTVNRKGMHSKFTCMSAQDILELRLGFLHQCANEGEGCPQRAIDFQKSHLKGAA